MNKIAKLSSKGIKPRNYNNCKLLVLVHQVSVTTARGAPTQSWAGMR